MVTFGEINSTAPVSYPLPLQCQCPQATTTPSSRTAMGRRCNILCCTDLCPRIHFTQSLIYNLIFHSVSVANPSSVTTSDPSTPSHHSEPSTCRHSPTLGINMPRTRHRMRSRKGGSGGRLPRSPLAPASETTSSSAPLTSGRYPNPRSGRCRSRPLRLHLTHSTSPPCEIPSNPQPPLHSAQFFYRCSLNQPIITATISITSHEEVQTIEGGCHSSATPARAGGAHIPSPPMRRSRPKKVDAIPAQRQLRSRRAHTALD